jgi:hypothetical protein
MHPRETRAFQRCLRCCNPRVLAVAITGEQCKNIQKATLEKSGRKTPEGKGLSLPARHAQGLSPSSALPVGGQPAYNHKIARAEIMLTGSTVAQLHLEPFAAVALMNGNQ